MSIKLASVAYNKIFIQAGPTGDNTGWGDLVWACTEAGIPVFAAASDSMTLLYDLQIARQQSGVPHQGNFIPTIDKDGERFDFDYTIYPNADVAKRAYQVNAINRWQKAEQVIPPELDPVIITISLENEQRPYTGWGSAEDPDNDEWKRTIPGFTGWADAFGWQAYYTGLEAIQRGYKYAAFGFAGGNPEEGAWEQPGMLAYLRLCAQFPDWLGVALHEYSFTLNLEDGWGDKIGRFQQLHETCDRHGIARPFIQIKEFGWQERTIPPQAAALKQIETVAELYAAHRNIVGAAIWTTSGGWGTASRAVSQLIPPLQSFTLDWRHYADYTPPPHAPEVNLLANPSFENGWETIEAGYGGLKNQRPYGWNLRWLLPGERVWAKNSKTDEIPEATTVPECLHKIDWQLPPEERNGGARELILDGTHVYKVFAQNGVWGVELSQTVNDLPPDAMIRIHIPVQVHYQDILNPDSPDDVEIHVLVNDELAQRTLAIPDLPDREWSVLLADGRADSEGKVSLKIRLMNKWPNSRDIFLDALFLTVVDESMPQPPPAVPVPPSPPTADCRGLPREPYGRIYNVIPPHATEEQAVAIFLEGWRRSRETSGGSYDDAGIGDLPNKTARLYGLAGEETKFRQWYAQHYPGTAVVFAPIPSAGHTPAPSPPTTPPKTGAAVMGLHASADPGELYGGVAEYEEFKKLRPGVIKLLSGHSGQAIERLAMDQKSIGNQPHFIIRTFLHFGGRDVSPAQFFEWTINDTQRAVAALKRAGVADDRILIELHNEPNLTDEGLGRSWQDGHGFASWGKAVLAQYRQALPSLKMLYPGLSPGTAVTGVRYGAAEFLAQSASFAEACDAVGVHAYWQAPPWGIEQALSWVSAHAQAFPSKDLWLTEASWNQRDGELPSAEFYATQYQLFVEELKRVPAVRGVTFFVASASNPYFEPECWIINGRSRGIAEAIRRG